jgi:uncharacterized membrane protein YfcA
LSKSKNINKIEKKSNNNNMIYLIVFFTGLLNAIFASGAGQILVVYLIFILKLESHEIRRLSICLLSFSSIFSFIGYVKIVNLQIKIMLILILVATLSGIIGSKIMKKISSDILNLISGIIVISLILFRVFIKG